MWENHYLIYIRRGQTLWPLGILEAASRFKAVRRSWRNEWEYSKEKAHAWGVGEFPFPVIYQKAPLKDWWEVIDAHRRRRNPPTWEPKLKWEDLPKRREALGPQGQRLRYLRDKRWREWL